MCASQFTSLVPTRYINFYDETTFFLYARLVGLITLTTQSTLAGFLPAHIRFRRDPLPQPLAGKQTDNKRARHKPPISRSLPHQLLPASVANRLCNRDSRDSDDLPFLQRLPRVDRGSIVLSTNSVFPHRNAHRAVENAQVFLHLDMAEDPDLGVPDRVARCRCRVHSGACYRPQNIQALPNSRLNCYILLETVCNILNKNDLQDTRAEITQNLNITAY